MQQVLEHVYTYNYLFKLPEDTTRLHYNHTITIPRDSSYYVHIPLFSSDNFQTVVNGNNNL